MKYTNLLLFMAAAAVTDAGTLRAQTASWTRVGYSSAPSARADAAIAYDAATHSTVLFGGNDGRSVYGDTWTWDVTWNAMLPVTSPSPRQGPAMAFDGAAGNVVLFGGSSFPFATGTAYGDTWTWDGINWTEQFPPVSPSPRLWSTMVYDPKDKTVLLFGGSNTSGGDDAFSDTWAWNGVSKTWTELHPTSHPSGRAANQLVYDAANRTVVLFGGVTTNLTPLFEKPTDPRQLWTEHRIATELNLDQPNSVDVADFDGDGRPDILVAEKAGAGRVIVLRNEGGGQFTPVVIAQGRPVQFARAVDVNGDGRPDILLIRADAISWLENLAPRQ